MSLNQQKKIHLKTLHELFNTEHYEGDDDFKYFKEIFKITGIPSQNQNPMKFVLNHIYENDDIDLLKRMLRTYDTIKEGTNFGFDYESDVLYNDHEFFRSDSSDDNDQRSSYEAEYGEEGTYYYYLYSKNFRHEFSEDAPFADDLFYCTSTEIK